MIDAQARKDEIDGSLSEFLQLRIGFLAGNPRQVAIKNISCERVMQNDRNPLKRDRRVPKFFSMLFQQGRYKGCGACRTVDVPGLAHLRAGSCLSDCQPVKLDGSF